MAQELAAQQTVSPDSDSGLLEDFVQALQTSTGWQVSPERHFEVPFPAIDGQQRLDALLQLAAPEPGVWLAIEMTRQGYPRDIKHALWQLDEYCRRGQGDKRVLPVVLGRHLSPGARELLRSRNVAYYDASGSLFLRHDQVLVDIERPGAAAPRSKPVSLFTGAREQVAHALLQSRGEWISGRQLAAQADTSPFTVSQTLSELERMEWVQSDGAGRTARRRLAQPGALLDAWAEAWKARDERKSRWFLFTANQRLLPDVVASTLEDAGIADWTFTGAVAGNALSPLLTSLDVVDLIVQPGQAERVAQAIGAKQADKGANLMIVERSGASDLFRRSYPNHPALLASPFVVYLDLLKEARGRNKELAAQLRSTFLKV